MLPAKDYLRALRLRRPAGAALDRCSPAWTRSRRPSLPTVAWPLDAPFDKVYPDYPGGTSIGGAANVCGVPGLFLPNGLGEAGLPTSLQLTGRGRREDSSSPIGMRYQRRTEHHRRRPPGL